MDISWKWFSVERPFNISHIDTKEDMYICDYDQIFKFEDDYDDNKPLFIIYDNCKICSEKEYLKSCKGHSTHLYSSFIDINPIIFKDITISKNRELKIDKVLED